MATVVAPAATVAKEPAPTTPQASNEDRAEAPCEGCLDEQAAIVIAEDILFQEETSYMDIWAELYADVRLTPDRKRRLPPPDLLDAPEAWPLGPHLPAHMDRPGETWVVWYQTGWLGYEKLESYIRIGLLPPVARSWPPLKTEGYVLLDARTGDRWLNYHEIGDREELAAAQVAH